MKKKIIMIPDGKTLPVPIPENVRKAERYLCKVYPRFFKRVSGFRNCGFVEDLEYWKIEAIAETQRIPWYIIGPIFLMFCGVAEPGEIEVMQRNLKTVTPRRKFSHGAGVGIKTK